MPITVDIPDDLYATLCDRAARLGLTVDELINKLLRAELVRLGYLKLEARKKEPA